MSPTTVNISESPKIRNCGAIQKMESLSFSFKAEFLLLCSIIAAETMEKVAMKRPIPTLWRGVIPSHFL
ncbi:UNVERIFIED_CONTAM: hypothetical protein Sradi_5215100 [Sesamum radiatum]|uniref:Uncharacterized protein n=1 Tax=Sesamum radiatum TaxID=300843 RepID=A0AAW2M5X8_SESRA